MTHPYIYPRPTTVADEVEFTVRMSKAGFDKLLQASMPVSEIWLTRQPDDTYALGVVTAEPPAQYGLEARKVEHDDILTRFPGGIPE